jgi:hypothetical protein
MVGALLAIAFFVGAMVERHHWTEEVTGRGYATLEDDELLWKSMPREDAMHEIDKEYWAHAAVACCGCGVLYEALMVLSEKKIDEDNPGAPRHGEEYQGQDCRICGLNEYKVVIQ